jgi:lipopolysaccharide export system protein LptA
MQASGNVTLSNGSEAAESERATYEVAGGVIEMEGDVLLTQGENALSSQSLRIDLNDGTGLLQGRVQTIFQPGADR